MDLITERLTALKDNAYGDFQSGLIPDAPRGRILGVRMPAMRKLAKELKGTPEAEAFLASLPHAFYDENILHVQLLNLEKDYAACLAGVERYLPYITNWAECDGLNPKVFQRHRAALYPRVEAWIAAAHAYTCRFGLVTLMTHFLGDAFSPEVPELAASVRREEYYVCMAQAWFFATALAKKWEETLPYIEGARLSPAVRKMTLRKAAESFRVTEEHKAYLRAFG